jgi:septal ring factor EnvC (AmiA/AmiB activator)
MSHPRFDKLRGVTRLFPSAGLCRMKLCNITFLQLGLCWLLAGAMGSLGEAADPKNQPNKSQEKKQDARVQSARQDVGEIQKKMQAAMNEARSAEVQVRKLQEAIGTAKKEVDKTKERLENWISQNIGLKDAVEAQRTAQRAYDDASKPVIESMKDNPKYAELGQRMATAEKTIKDIGARKDLDETTRQKLLGESSKVLADWRYAVSKHLETASELTGPREKLAAAQEKVSQLRSQLKLQLEAHPDYKSALKKWEKAKGDVDKAEAQVLAARRKAASENSKLASEKAQLSKAIAQDKQNDNRKNSKNRRGSKK